MRRRMPDPVTREDLPTGARHRQARRRMQIERDSGKLSIENQTVSIYKIHMNFSSLKQNIVILIFKTIKCMFLSSSYNFIFKFNLKRCQDILLHCHLHVLLLFHLLTEYANRKEPYLSVYMTCKGICGETRQFILASDFDFQISRP